MSALKFPGGALVFYIAELLFPAWKQAVFASPLVDQQEIDVPFNMSGAGSPSLLVAVYRLQRHTEQFR